MESHAKHEPWADETSVYPDWFRMLTANRHRSRNFEWVFDPTQAKRERQHAAENSETKAWISTRSTHLCEGIQKDFFGTNYIDIERSLYFRPEQY